MGKECGAWVSRRLWGGGNTSPLKTTAWEASVSREIFNFFIFCPNNPYSELFSKILFKGPEAL